MTWIIMSGALAVVAALVVALGMRSARARKARRKNDGGDDLALLPVFGADFGGRGKGHKEHDQGGEGGEGGESGGSDGGGDGGGSD